jgi:hypothetical protein
MFRFRPRLTYANVVSTICLFVLLGGGAYAATELPANSVGTKQLKKNAVTLKKIKASTRDALKGRRGATGLRGPRGRAGPGAARLDFAENPAPTVTKTLFSRQGLSIAATCSKEVNFGDTRLELNLTASGPNATVDATWIHQFHSSGTPTPLQDGIGNGTITISAQGHNGFDRDEGQAVLRTDGLTVGVTFFAVANYQGTCVVKGTATPAT